jgi:hypothetical protein
MEKVGTGPKLPPSAASKFGLYSAPTPTIMVQSPDADGGKGISKGGAGRVKAVWAAAGLGEAIIAPKAARTAARRLGTEL